jgi:hypothetical protein
MHALSLANFLNNFINLIEVHRQLIKITFSGWYDGGFWFTLTMPILCTLVVIIHKRSTIIHWLIFNSIGQFLIGGLAKIHQMFTKSTSQLHLSHSKKWTIWVKCNVDVDEFSWMKLCSTWMEMTIDYLNETCGWYLNRWMKIWISFTMSNNIHVVTSVKIIHVIKFCPCMSIA